MDGGNNLKSTLASTTRHGESTSLLNLRGQIDYLNAIFLIVTLTCLYGWGSGNHKNDQVADLFDHTQCVSSEQLHIVIGISYGSVTLPLLWFYGRLLPNLFWWRTWSSWNPKVTKNGARMITLRSPIWPRAIKSVYHFYTQLNGQCFIHLVCNHPFELSFRICVSGSCTYNGISTKLSHFCFARFYMLWHHWISAF